jgi:tRNA(Met) C34 N-acetyltransferase TmcA
MKSSQASDALDRSAASDLWRNTLSQIPSLFGRLVYLASLRNANSGRYEHHGLALRFGEDEANKALKKSHSQAFREWLTFSLEQQKADLELYLSALVEDKRTVLTNWLELAPYLALIPATIRGIEKRLYLADLKALLDLLGNEHGAAGPDPIA